MNGLLTQILSDLVKGYLVDVIKVVGYIYCPVNHVIIATVYTSHGRNS